MFHNDFRIAEACVGVTEKKIIYLTYFNVAPEAKNPFAILKPTLSKCLHKNICVCQTIQPMILYIYVYK